MECVTSQNKLLVIAHRGTFLFIKVSSLRPHAALPPPRRRHACRVSACNSCFLMLAAAAHIHVDFVSCCPCEQDDREHELARKVLHQLEICPCYFFSPSSLFFKQCSKLRQSSRDWGSTVVVCTSGLIGMILYKLVQIG